MAAACAAPGTLQSLRLGDTWLSGRFRLNPALRAGLRRQGGAGRSGSAGRGASRVGAEGRRGNRPPNHSRLTGKLAGPGGGCTAEAETGSDHQTGEPPAEEGRGAERGADTPRTPRPPAGLAPRRRPTGLTLEPRGRSWCGFRRREMVGSAPGRPAGGITHVPDPTPHHCSSRDPPTSTCSGPGELFIQSVRTLEFYLDTMLT
nr:uncharacterized protein LOC103351623 [Oryctolagus cuniculus]